MGFEAEKKKWEEQAKKGNASQEDEDFKKKEMAKMAMELVNKEILELLPKTKEAKKIVDMLDRENLSFEVSMQRAGGDALAPSVKIRVGKSDTNGTVTETILIETFEFM